MAGYRYGIGSNGPPCRDAACRVSSRAGVDQCLPWRRGRPRLYGGGGKKKVKNHRKVAWESDNIKVAKVDKNGKITAVDKGSCYIYAYAQNGIYARVKITVE